MMKLTAGVLSGFAAVVVFAGSAFAGDVGGNVYSSPGTITVRLEWGSSFQNAKEIDVTGDSGYSSA